MLRRLAKVSMVMAIVASILFGALSASFAAGEINYEEFFAEALKTNSGTAEGYTADAVRLYDSDPESFIKALYRAPSDQVDVITVRLASGHDADLSGFRQQILEFLGDEAFEEEVPLLNQILEAISYYEDLVSRIAENTKNYSFPESAFYVFDPIFLADKIRGRLHDVDEEFSRHLMDMYCMDPELFAKTVASFEDEDIGVIGSRIAWALAKLSKEIPDRKRMLTLNEGETETLELLEKEIAKKPATVEQTPLPEDTNSTLRADDWAYFENVQWDNLPLVATHPEKLNFTVRDGAISVGRNFFVELHVYRSGTWWLKGSKWVWMAAGVSSVPTYFDVTFDDPGTLQTRLQVYSQGGTVVSDTWTETSTRVYGEWRINVELQKDRTQVGSLTLRNATGGYVAGPFDCLGNSIHPGLTMWDEYGPTPTGETGGKLDGYRPGEEYSYGPHQVIWLDPYYSGVFVETTRDDILIHGGTLGTGNALRATEGCIRVSNPDQFALEDAIETLASPGSSYSIRGGRIIVVNVDD